MAKQAASTKKTTKTTTTGSKSPVVTKTTIKTVAAATEAREARTKAAMVAEKGFTARFNRTLTPHALISEAVGTFILGLVTFGLFTTFSLSSAAPSLGPIYVGLTYALLAIVLGGISGSHLNPAVTFGLWTARRFSGFAVPFYWIAQFIGALAAVLIMAVLTGNGLNLNLSHFFSNFDWGVFAIEAIGTAVLLLGFMAARHRLGLSTLGRSLGVGLALLVALTTGTSLYSSLKEGVDITNVQAVTDVPRTLRLDGPIYNPALALGVTEKTNNEIQPTGAADTESSTSRLTLGETLVAPLLGAALGANLYRILSRREDR